jgi:hypothetical protein
VQLGASRRATRASASHARARPKTR